MRRAPPVVAALVITAACGPKRPPPSFAPDPGLVSQIRELRMSTNATACPGESFGAAYTAVLNDGSLVPFETRYDQDHPPRLHVVFLERSSYEASPLEGGGWSAARDPLASAMTGFRLTATFRAKPSVTKSTVVAPDYSCLPHTFGFRGTGAGTFTGDPKRMEQFAPRTRRRCRLSSKPLRGTGSLRTASTARTMAAG